MQLPVSGLEVSFRLPDGRDDLTLLESRGASLERSLVALTRLARFNSAHQESESKTTWLSLTVTDFEIALLGLRRFLFGDTVSCIAGCNCGTRMEVEFSITNLVENVLPRIPREV